MNRTLVTRTLAAVLVLAGASAASAQTNFGSYVSIGDSLAAGFESGSLVETHQVNSVPAHLARAAGVSDFQLPLVGEPGADNPETRAPPGTKSVLVVEDEELVRDFACRLINAQGYRCLQAANGAEALEWVQERGDELDLILTDVVMPVMGGREMADRVARLRPGLPVLYMSAYSAEEVARRGLLPPDVPFVQKPFTPSQLAREPDSPGQAIPPIYCA